MTSAVRVLTRPGPGTCQQVAVEVESARRQAQSTAWGQGMADFADAQMERAAADVIARDREQVRREEGERLVRELQARFPDAAAALRARVARTRQRDGHEAPWTEGGTHE